MTLNRLVQSTYLWFGKLKGVLQNFGFTQSKHNDVLFYNTFYSLFINVYVDDIKVFYLGNIIIFILKKDLQSKYKLKDISNIT